MSGKEMRKDGGGVQNHIRAPTVRLQKEKKSFHQGPKSLQGSERRIQNALFLLKSEEETRLKS